MADLAALMLSVGEVTTSLGLGIAITAWVAIGIAVRLAKTFLKGF